MSIKSKYKYQCLICLEQFPCIKDHYDKHPLISKYEMRKEHIADPYVCWYCKPIMIFPYAWHTEEDLDKHTREIHPDQYDEYKRIYKYLNTP